MNKIAKLSRKTIILATFLCLFIILPTWSKNLQKNNNNEIIKDYNSGKITEEKVNQAMNKFDSKYLETDIRMLNEDEKNRQ